MTSVSSVGASAFTTCDSAEAATAVASSANWRIVLMVHAASPAVMGVPSDQLPFFRVKVYTVPSSDTVHDSARSPSNSFESGRY